MPGTDPSPRSPGAAGAAPHRRGEHPGARPCSIAAALSVVGERWALLAVREINWGNTRFDQIARNTGASRDILTNRLRLLEAEGIIARKQYQDRPARYEYHLTQAGRELRPVLDALRVWGDRWRVGEPSVRFVHKCGEQLDLVPVCRHCGERVRGAEGEWTAEFLNPAWDAHGPVL